MEEISFTLKDKLIVHDQKAFLSYLRKNKLTKEKLLVNHFAKKDLYNGEPIEYKNEEHYLNNDFNNRDNLNNYLISNKHKAEKYCIDFLSKRKEKKDLVFAPSQIELKSYIAPSINIIQKGIGLDYNDIIKNIGYKPRFNYKGSFKLIDNCEPLKIIQDTREQKPLDFENVEIKTLSFGDYTVLPPYFSNVFIERKSLADFIGTLSPKNIDRFKAEIARATEMNAYLIVVIEEDFNQLLRMKELRHIKSQASPDFILHKMREILESTNVIQFLFVNNRKESKRVIKKIFRLGKQVKNLDLEYVYNCGKL